MPDGNVVEFPEGMPDSEISKHVQTYIGNKGAASPISPPPVPRPASGMHPSYLMGDENEDPSTPASNRDLRSAATGLAGTVYSPSAPNVATQLLKKMKGQPSDLITPVENAIGMMAGEEGIVGGEGDAIAGRAVAPKGELADAAAGGRSRSLPASGSPSPPSGATVGPSAIDLLKAGSKLIPGVGKAAHLADFASTAAGLLKRIRSGSESESEAAATAPAAPLASHESTAVPQSFPPTAGYPVSGRPVATTHEWLGANSPGKTVEEPADLSSTVPITTSVKPILQKATINNGPGTSDIPGANGGVSSTRPEAIAKLVKKSAPALPVRGPGGRMMKAGNAAASLVDDAAVAGAKSPAVSKLKKRIGAANLGLGHPAMDE